MKSGRIGIIKATGEKVTIIPMERIEESKTVVWEDVSESGHAVYRLFDGRTLLASYVRLTDETAELRKSRKKSIPEPVDEEQDERDEQEPELAVPAFTFTEEMSSYDFEPLPESDKDRWQQESDEDGVEDEEILTEGGTVE